MIFMGLPKRVQPLQKKKIVRKIYMSVPQLALFYELQRSFDNRRKSLQPPRSSQHLELEGLQQQFF
jgi:hypothetical protein